MKVLITGSLSGLGYEYAKALAKRGHIVYAGVENEEQQKSLEQKIKDERIILFPVIINLLQEDTMEKIEKLDVDSMILQAGIGEGGSLLEIDLKRFETNYDINVFGNMKLIQMYLQDRMIKQKKGKILITSSLAGFIPLPYLGGYTSSKLSLFMLAKTLKIELWFQKIPVDISVILPGAYFTGFNEVFIENKYKDALLLSKKAKIMSKYQKIIFSVIESYQYQKLVKRVVKAVENKYHYFIIGAPSTQLIAMKFYGIMASLLEL